VEGKGRPGRKADNLTAICEKNMGTSTSQKPIGIHGLLQGWFYVYLLPVRVRVRVRVTLRLPVYCQSVHHGTEPLETHGQIYFLQLNTCGHSPHVTSPLTRGWVCRLQLLPTFASAFILRSEYRRTHNHILLSQIRHSSNLERRSPVFISPRNRVAQLYPVTGFPLRRLLRLAGRRWR
jgi:hypothetical protein